MTLQRTGPGLAHIAGKQVGCPESIQMRRNSKTWGGARFCPPGCTCGRHSKDHPNYGQHGPARLAKWLEGRSKYLWWHPSESESDLMQMLDEFGIEYQFQAVIENRFIADFLIGSIDIEVDNRPARWLPNTSQQSRAMYLESLGYIVVHYNAGAGYSGKRSKRLSTHESA
jgi:hypothetical protein